MSSYEAMDVVELRHEYQAALEEACGYAREIARLWEADDWSAAANMYVAFKSADSRVRHLKRRLTVEAA